MFRNLALAAASTLVFGALIEGFARFREPAPVQRQEYLWDWSERFKDGDFYTFEKGEGYPPDEENNVDGLRDVTRPVETREGLRRVVVLGDSVAYGHGVEASEAFPQVLERRLQDQGGDVEVFNIGLPGWSTRQEKIAYERIARKYKPTTVVLAVCLNDLAELQINLSKPPPGFLLALFKRSAAVRLALGASRREIGAVEELFVEHDSARVKNAFRLLFEEVKSLEDAVAKDGATFLVVVFPFRFQVEPNAPSPSVQRRIMDFASAEGIEAFDFLPEILAAPAPTALFLDYDHFSKAGHERVAGWLAGIKEIAEIGESRQPRPTGTLLARLEAASSQASREAVLRNAAEAPDPQGRLREKVVALATDDPSPRVRAVAARTAFALGLPGEASIDALIRGVGHDDPRVRAYATWTLGEMGAIARKAVPALVGLAKLDGGAGRTKTGALTAIGKIGGESPETVPMLLQELKHPKENRRYRAARTIGRMGAAAASAVSGLTAALADPSPLVRLHVVRALGNLGDAARPALPSLIEILNKDADPEVRKEASLTLSKLPGR